MISELTSNFVTDVSVIIEKLRRFNIILVKKILALFSMSKKLYETHQAKYIILHLHIYFFQYSVCIAYPNFFKCFRFTEN